MSRLLSVWAAEPPKRGGWTPGMLDYSSPGLDGLGVGFMGGREGPPSPLATVSGIIQRTSGDIGALPRMIRRRGDPTRAEIRTPEFEHLWGQPNRNRRLMRPNAFWQAVAAACEGFSNGYIWPDRFGSGERWVGVRGLRYIHPMRVRPYWAEGERKRYRLDGNRERTYGAGDLVHITTRPAWNELEALSPIAHDVLTHTWARRLTRFGDAFMRNSTRASGVVTTKSEMTDTAVDEFYDRWEARHKGEMNAGAVVLLQGEDTEFHQVSISPEDANYIETMRFTREELISLYAPGLPPHLVGHHPDTSNYGTGIEQQSIAYVVYVILPRVRMLEDAVEDDLLPPDLEFRFNIKGLLRGDAKTRAEVTKMLRESGLLSADEGRAEDDYAPRGFADDYIVPMNYDRLDARTGEPRGEPMGEPMEPRRRRGTPVRDEPEEPEAIAEARCGIETCPSRRGSGRGKLLATNVARATLRCPECGTDQTFRAERPREEPRDVVDQAEMIAAEIADRL